MTEKPISFEKARVKRAAHEWHRLQSEAILELFSRERGRRPTNLEELNAWATTADLPRPIDPLSVLTPKQVEQFRKKRRHGAS